MTQPRVKPQSLAWDLAATWAAWVTLFMSLHAESPADYAVQVSATVQTNPARITLSWPFAADATRLTLYRKLLGDASWGRGTSLATSATTYTDSNVRVGGAYEYRVSKAAGTNYQGEGYLYVGIEAPLVESRGKVVLLVDNTHAEALSPELNRLQLDLVGDGWTVLRHDVPRMSVDAGNTSSNVWAARAAELAAIKSIIRTDYLADRSNVRAVFILGHIPVPYSGDLYVDGHKEHRGAWPVDAYYGDMDGTWSDVEVNQTGAGDRRNWNVPGDGKFDPTTMPSTIELQVGRVDLANLPSFVETERELLRRYLNKDHLFRHRAMRTEPRGLIDDQLGLSTKEPIAASGFRSFASFFGATNILSADWTTTLNRRSYLWGFGCGGGTFSSCGGVITTDQLATSDPQVVFTMLFGSWFADWDSPNNLLRAELATPSYTLTSAWVGRPPWFFHHMALGETIGFSTRLTQNNAIYDSYLAHFAQAALMGDPTLRLHPVAPPRALKVSTNLASDTVLTWTASSDEVAGYAVYRATTSAGPFTRLNPALTRETHYSVSGLNTNVFMVRAVKLETSASGSYFNPSQGIFQSLGGQVAAVRLDLIGPTNGSFYVAPAAVPLDVNAFDASGQILRTEFLANGIKVLETVGSPPRIPWTNVPAGAFQMIARATCADGNVVDSAAVNIRIESPLVADNTVWRYLDDGSDAGSAWREIEFDDSKWASGPAELGYGNSPATVVDYGGDTTNRHITTYFRKAFEVRDASAWTNLTLGVIRDDGALIYLNGQEVLRSNLPSDPIDYQTRATADVDGLGELRFTVVSLSPALLLAGTNVIAAEVHQSSPSSADLGFNLFLSGGATSTRAELTARWSDGRPVVAWPDTVFGYFLETSPALPSATWIVATNAILTEEGSNHVVLDASAEQQYFRLTASPTNGR